MKAWISILIALSIFISAKHKFPTSQNNNSSPKIGNFSLVETAPGIFVHYGLHVGFDHEHQDDIANIGFIVGKNCVAVIDTGGSVNVAEKLKQAIQTTTNKPICYVINTHVHFDHVLGNPVFDDEQTQFIGHLYLREVLESNREFFIEEFGANLGAYVDNNPIVVPDIGVEDTLEIDLGERLLELRAVADAHSNTDLIILDKQTDTLWSGDLLFVTRIPALDGSIRGWIKVLQSLRDEPFARVIPGHGKIVEWPEGSDAELAYLKLLRDSVRAGIEAGDFMEDVVREVGKEEKLQWLLHEQHHKRNVTKTFTELEWE